MSGLSVSFKADKKQILSMQQELELINLSEKKRQRLVWRLAKYGMIPAVARQIKKQEKIDGGAYKERQTHNKKDKKRKLLSKIAKRIAIKQNYADNSVVLYFKGHYNKTKNQKINAGVVADTQQKGKETELKSSMYEQNKEKQKGKPTERTIKTLRMLGYLIPNTNKKASKAWIEEHLTQGQAGGIIRMMTKHKGEKKEWNEWIKGKQSWSVHLPSRTFFDFTDEEYQKALIRELKAIEFGFDVKKQDMKK